ncbi:hypothetical protein PQ467_19690 (plasmid) [Novosphingobium sp. KACC 22771]|nr:hypothetical protein [Novosphingobium sp. KACC 22771]WDF75240.1 hypothetical protein PQ467_19690 [Novosphingobium sp. KACC 22771]
MQPMIGRQSPLYDNTSGIKAMQILIGDKAKDAAVIDLDHRAMTVHAQHAGKAPVGA